MRIGTKSLLDCRTFQAGLVSGYAPFELWFITTSCRLWSSTTPSPSTPPCALTVSGESYWSFTWCFMYSYICYADRVKRIATKYKASTISSLHWCKAWGDIWGKLALTAVRQCSSSWGKETHCINAFLQHQVLHWICCRSLLGFWRWGSWVLR